MRMSREDGYEPSCNIKDRFNCSLALGSKYASILELLFGVPIANATLGLIGCAPFSNRIFDFLRPKVIKTAYNQRVELLLYQPVYNLRQEGSGYLDVRGT